MKKRGRTLDEEWRCKARIAKVHLMEKWFNCALRGHIQILVDATICL
jgi:hypothetical protein